MYIGGIFAVMVNAGIDEDAFEPSLQGSQYIGMPGFLELVDALEEFNKTFIHDLFYLFKVVLIPVTYFHSIVLEHIVQLFLACAVIGTATLYQGVYLRVS
jgi:hypothetical protein